MVEAAGRAMARVSMHAPAAGWSVLQLSDRAGISAACRGRAGAILEREGGDRPVPGTRCDPFSPCLIIPIATLVRR